MISQSDIEVWQKAQSDTRDALNLIGSPDTPDWIFATLNKLRSATAAVQELECRTRGSKTTIG
jgi:hypothetical protein